jgi:hypothetical protein
MKTIHQLQAAESLQHKIGEQFRAMYAEEGSGRLLDLLRDFERIEIGEFRKRD